MSIKVIHPGLATTIQDLGRPGYYHLGIPISGAMDRLALRSANLLVGNDEGAACLEAVFMGPQLEFTEDALVASGLVRRKRDGIRVLAKGEITAKLDIEVSGASKSAIEAVGKAGGALRVTSAQAAE